MTITEEPYAGQYKFLEYIKPIETWVMITESHTWYHDNNGASSGPYFQTEMDGLAIDGCGFLYMCSIHLATEGHEHAKVEEFPLKYGKGSLHFIKSEGYCIQDSEVRFYIDKTEPVPRGFCKELRGWFESQIESEHTNIRCRAAFNKMLE